MPKEEELVRCPLWDTCHHRGCRHIRLHKRSNCSNAGCPHAWLGLMQDIRCVSVADVRNVQRRKHNGKR